MPSLVQLGDVSVHEPVRFGPEITDFSTLAVSSGLGPPRGAKRIAELPGPVPTASHRLMLPMLRKSATRFSAAAAVLVAALTYAAPSAEGAPQLDLPTKKKASEKTPIPPRTEKAPVPVNVPVAEPTPGPVPVGANEGKKSPANLGGKKTGTVAGKNVGEVQKAEQLFDKEGRAVGTVSTTRMNVPGQGASNNAGSNSGIDLPRSEPKGSGAGSGAGLALRQPEVNQPVKRGAAPQPWEAVPAAGQDGTTGEEFDPLGDLGSSRTAARFLFDRLKKVRRISDVETTEITDHLARLGDDGLRVARYCLSQDSDVLSFAGARTILISGSAADADLVVQRLRNKLPSRSGQMILTELIERDPVRASTPFLASMLRHSSGSIRRVAERELRKRLTLADVPLLAVALDDRSTDVRKAATSLVSGLEDSTIVTELLLERVVDRSSSVAEIAIEGIARASEGEPSFELLRRVFASGEVLREEAQLIIAIVEREDRGGTPIFGEEHVGALLGALDSPLPIVNTAAALALAGLGFRSEDEGSTPWLDGPVPSSLVAIASGSTFFDGFSLVREPCLRRLRLISGVNHGSNGPDWADWWGKTKHRFQADRAVITVEPGDSDRIVLRVDAPSSARGPRELLSGEARPFVLAGPALSQDAKWLALEEERAGALGVDVLFLTVGDAADLTALLSEQGVFGGGRLPGPRGSFGSGGRSIEVQVGRRAKSFGFSIVQSQPWFERIIERSHGLAEQNAWQRFPVAGVHANMAELFAAEADWWSAPRTAHEKHHRFLSLLLDHLSAAPVAERASGIGQLERLVAREASSDELGVDYPEGLISSLIGLLGEETVFGIRARKMASIGSTMIQNVETAGRAGDGAEDMVAPERAELVTVLHNQFGPLALPSIGAVLQGGGRRAVLGAAVDERITLRIAAALILGQGDEDEDVDLLLGLLDDEAEDVEIAAIAGLAQRKASRARPAIEVRARGSVANRIPVATRAASLRALGAIGGNGALEVLVAGLQDSDERLHLPAAEGLASLGTPETAALLVSLLRGTRRQSIQTVAKEGLLSLGEAGHNDLFSAMRSPDKLLQRDAAVLLAQQLVPRAVPVLAETIAVDPDDTLAMEELAILTCVDYSDEALPADRYFQWWDEVNHSDSFAWFVAAMEQRGLRAPEASAFAEGGTTEARLFLLTVVREVDGNLGVRALRELERLHGSRLGKVPLRMAERDAWFIKTRSLTIPEEVPGDAAAAGGRD